MERSRLDLVDVPSSFAPGTVPCAVLCPEVEHSSLPLCLFLHGGRSGREMLVETRGLFEQWWADGTLPPMLVATPSTGPASYYLDHPDGSALWETFVARELVSWLGDRHPLQGRPGLIGVSMGGLGVLKMAFRQPECFRAVSAVQPMIEPGLRSEDVRPRNRFYYLGDGPDALLGPDRDPVLFEQNNPASRARDNADAIRQSGLEIRIEVGDEDALNAQDGAEFLHRVLWALDIPHEYHLVRGGDHLGPSLLPRLQAAFAWLGARMRSQGQEGIDPSDAMRQMLRQEVAAARAATEAVDPTVGRRLGLLPAVDELLSA